MNLLKPLDVIIDQITMYRLMIYYLVFLLLAAMGLNIFGDLRYSWWSVGVSTTILILVCWGLNKAFGFLFKAPLNNESPLITAGILALIITPDMTKIGIVFLLAAGGLAVASKYLIAINRKHIFNPAAFAVLLTSLGANQTPSWWVGSAVMLPFVIAGGLVIMRKLRRNAMILTFLITTSAATAVPAIMGGGDPLTSLRNMALSSAVFFLGFVMLTEPLTTPVTRGKQTLYAGLVGLLVPPQIHLFSFYSSPELALIIGNFFSFLDNPKTKLFPVLKDKLQIADNTADFVFALDKPLTYQPGQYLEVTLPHPHKDSRGERRYFTLASSPTEPELRLGVKFYDPSSSYKRAMLAMTAETKLAAGQIAGDFVLPSDASRKLAFIAGGIGITPFRSMVKYMIDQQQPRDAVLLYAAKTRKDIAYRSVFERARQKLGLQTTYVLDGEPASNRLPYAYSGTRITAQLIQKEIPDYSERLFYISGTHTMVDDIKAQLRELGVPWRHIKTDFFPGYA